MGFLHVSVHCAPCTVGFTFLQQCLLPSPQLLSEHVCYGQAGWLYGRISSELLHVRISSIGMLLLNSRTGTTYVSNLCGSVPVVVTVAVEAGAQAAARM